MAVLELEVITDISRLIEIKDKWLNLEDRLDYRTPFQSPDWLLTWWRHFGNGDLRVFVFRNPNKEIVGILPAFLHEWQAKRQLTLIGSGISDFLEPALMPDVAQEAARCLADYLYRDPEWEVCNWQDLSADTVLTQCTVGRVLKVSLLSDIPCAEIRIDGGFSEFWAERPSGLRRNVRRYREKAEQVGRIETCVIESSNEECLEALIRLHSARWREAGEPGMIAANRSAAFLRDVVERFEQRAMLLFFSLRFRNEVAAVILTFPYRGTLYAYLSAFDPAYAAFGFGRTLLHDALKYAVSNGYRAWNFLRGNEPYKVEWGAREIPKSRLIIQREPAPS